MPPVRPDNRTTMVSVVKALEETHGKNVALGEAVRWSLREEIERLLDEGQDVNGLIPPYDVTPVMLCSNTAIAKMLVKRGASINQQDARGMTPLHGFLSGIYPKKKARKFIETLIELGADPSIASRDGRLPIELAREKYNDLMDDILRSETREGGDRDA